jgi:Outer membrane lipoprotein-sorting protein
MRAVATVQFVALSASLCAADFNAASPTPAASPILEPVKEGQELATKLRSAVPEESSEFSGVLEITAKDGRQVFIPISSKITVNSNQWQVVYQSAPTNGTPAETLTILHSPGQTNRYNLAIGAKPAITAPLTHPFAGSDFWLLDLGLEFYHWPQQKALRAEMSRSRPCRVLESVTTQPAPDGYARVLSWIDNESGGVLQAEAYDQQGKLLKKFALGPMQKVEGQYRLREMRIRNARTGQRTELKFDLRQK